MSDTIGRISVPALVDSLLTFPLTSDFGYGFRQERPVVVHQFGELDAKASSAMPLASARHTVHACSTSVNQVGSHHLPDIPVCVNCTSPVSTTPSGLKVPALMASTTDCSS